jgi:Gas vesicle synthesis protein GvpL/GvpF
MTVQEPADTSASVAYVYGVVGSTTSPAVHATGVGGATVRTVPFGEVAALVSSVSPPIRAKRRELMSHAEVLNDISTSATVVPLRFGTIFHDPDSVVTEFLEPRHDELAKLLETLAGRAELMVKAYYVEEAILAEIVREDRHVARLRAATLERPPAAAHAERIELGRAVAAALEARAAADSAAILDVLRPFALDVRVDETPIEHQVLRASVLVDRGHVPAVDAALSELAERNAGRIRFKYVGPLAPHSFVAVSSADGR